MKKIHNESPDKGYRRIRDDLARYYGAPVNDKRALRICRSLGIRSTIKYARHGCTRRASDPQYLAENVLVHETLDRALAANPDAHPLLHSDRGFQYTTRVFHDKLAAAGMTQSMSQVGKCIDNGPMEGYTQCRAA